MSDRSGSTRTDRGKGKKKPPTTGWLSGLPDLDPPADGLPTWAFEHMIFAQGFMRVAGLDEAGRGPLAGPIVAAAVILREPVDGLNDSKQLTEAARDTLFDTLHAGGHSIGVCVIESETIDAIGIQAANYKAMLDAAAQLDPRADFYLVDGFRLPDCPVPHHRVVKGDCLSQSIAAASIVAKVTRDRIMVEWDKRYPGYGFARHKGYCTRMHLEAIDRIGPCPIHRRSFAPLAQAQVTDSLFSTGLWKGSRECLD